MREEPRFQCPVCGGYFAVRSWYSERIYCSRWCREHDRQRDKTLTQYLAGGPAIAAAMGSETEVK